MIEVEQKYRVKKPSLIRARLKRLGAKKLASGFERNELWDRNGELKKKNRVLRLRQYGKWATLTFKGPRLSGTIKRRLEIETQTNYAVMRRILEELGFRIYFRYSKTREIYCLSSCEVVLDKLPKMGWFVEIEGSVSAIKKTAALLGLGEKDQEDRSYPQLLGKSWLR